MAEVTERDPLVTRRCILDEFEKVEAEIETNPESWRKLSFEAHGRICETMGEDFVNYPEFEFWFVRFVRGKLYLDYDRSCNPKARSFIDLPLEIFKKIGEYLKLEDRMQLRDVSKDIRYQVDNWDLKLTEISYTAANDWRACDRHCSGSTQNSISFVISVLKLPNLRLEKLTIHRQDNYWKELVKRLDESNQKLHVKKVDFPYGYPSSKIGLHFLIPGVLEEIIMFLSNPTREEMLKIIESEQCQAAKMVYINIWKFTSKFPLEALHNCPRFNMKLIGKPADDLKSKFLKNLMKYGKVQKCVLYISKSRAPHSQLLKYFNEPEAMVPNFPSLRRYPIPGTNEIYELEFRLEGNRLWEQFVRLERKH